MDVFDSDLSRELQADPAFAAAYDKARATIDAEQAAADRSDFLPYRCAAGHELALNDWQDWSGLRHCAAAPSDCQALIARA